MAKLNKRFKFTKDTTNETFYADIYSSIGDLEEGQPYLSTDVKVDENTIMPGYVQGSTNSYDENLLDIYIKPDDATKQTFRLKSKSYRNIANGVTIYSQPGQYTFNIPVGVTKVCVITVAGGSEYDYVHNVTPKNITALKAQLLSSSVDTYVTETGKTDRLISSSVDYQTVSFDGSPIIGYGIDGVTGKVTRTEIPVNTPLYFGTPSGLYNDTTSAYRHSASGQLRSTVIDVSNIESLNVVVGNFGNATDNTSPKRGTSELVSADLPLTTKSKEDSGTSFHFGNGEPTMHVVKVDAIGMGGAGSQGLSPNTNDPGTQPYAEREFARMGNVRGTVVKVATSDKTIANIVSMNGNSALLGDSVITNNKPIPGAKFNGTIDTNPAYPGLNSLTADQLEAGRGLPGKSVKQIWIEGVEGYDNPILEGGAGGLPGHDGEPGKVSKFFIIEDGVTKYIKSGGGGAGAGYIAGKLITINGDEYANNNQVNINATYDKSNGLTPGTTGNYNITYGGTIEPKVRIGQPNIGIVSIIYGPEIENMDIPLYTWTTDQESYVGEQLRYTANGIEGNIKFSPKRIFISHEFVKDETAASGAAFMQPSQKAGLENLVLEYMNDRGVWTNFKTASISFTMLTEEGQTYIDIPLRVYSTKWRLRLPDENLHLKSKNGVKIDSYITYTEDEMT